MIHRARYPPGMIWGHMKKCVSDEHVSSQGVQFSTVKRNVNADSVWKPKRHRIHQLMSFREKDGKKHAAQGCNLNLDIVRNLCSNVSSNTTTNETKTVEDAVKSLLLEFSMCNVSEPRESAEYIVAHALGRKTLQGCLLSQRLSSSQWQAINVLKEDRKSNKPIQYVIGEWDFRDLTLEIRPPVFIPRPETEELVGLIYDNLENTVDFLEIGPGSGAISISLLRTFSHLNGVAIDKSKEAVEATQLNATRLGVLDRLAVIHTAFNLDTPEQFFHSRSFGLIVSNPPYIKTCDMSTLPDDVSRFEDQGALHGGTDGLSVILPIIQAAPKLLRKGGSVWLEVDSSHPDVIEEYVHRNPHLELTYVNTYNDFRNIATSEWIYECGNDWKHNIPANF